jgi:hypothetical protein
MTAPRTIQTLCTAGLACALLAGPAAALQRQAAQRQAPPARANTNAPARTAAPAAARGNGLADFNDDALINELASRGLDSLLDRAFDVNNVPPEQRAGIKAFGALRELTDKRKPPTAERRAALISQVVAGARTVLPTLKDPSKLMEYASLLLTEGVMRDVNLLEYWGENPATQNRLRPVIEVVIEMLDKAADEGEAQKASIEKRMNNPGDRAAADQWMKLEEAVATARYTRHMADYYHALSIPAGPGGAAQRAKIADEGIKYLKDLDSADYNVQPVVRNRIAKLNMAKGDYAAAKEVFQTVIDKKGLTPEPDASQQYEARYFSAVCDVDMGNLDAARKDLADLLKWQKENLPNTEDVQKGVAAAADMMQYRIHMAAAEADRKAGREEQARKGEAAAVEVLMKLAERPELKSIIMDQLVERTQITGSMQGLDTLLLRALVQKGITDRDRPASEKADDKVLTRAVEAARELSSRKGTKGVDERLAESADLLVPTFLERLGKKVKAADAYLKFLEKYPNSPQRETAFNNAGALIVMDLRRGPDKGSKEVVDVWTRFLPIAIGPPFNRTGLAFDLAERRRAEQKYKEAADFYGRVPANDPRYVSAKYLQMVSLYSLLMQSAPGDKGGSQWAVQGEQRKQLAAEVLRLAEEAKKLAQGAMAKAADDKDRARQQLKVAGATLTMAEVAAGEQNDPKRTLDALAQFETEVKGLPGSQDMLNRALFLRIKSLMGSGQYDEATRSLVALLEKTGGQQGQEIVFDLLSRLNDDFAKAEAAGDTKAMAAVAQNRARLSGFLVNWARNNKNPDIQKRFYSYSVYDAESKLRAGMLARDPGQLKEALAAFQKLQSPEMEQLYRKEAAGNAKVDPNYPHPNVLLGIGLAAFELGDYMLAQENLGRLVVDRKLGSAKLEKVDEKTNESVYVDNENYWEAWYKLLRSNVELYKKNKNDESAKAAYESAQAGLKRLYVQGDVGGQKWKAAFDALRTEIIPDFDPTKLTAPATGDVAGAAATRPKAQGPAAASKPASTGAVATDGSDK